MNASFLVSEGASQKVTSFLDMQDPLELQAILSSETENEILFISWRTASI